jgi:hypothetical protein
MNKSTIKRKRALIDRIAAGALFIIASAMGVSALCPPGQYHPRPRGQCKDWLTGLKQGQLDNIKNAFNAAIAEAVPGSKCRERLLDPNEAKKVIEEKSNKTIGPNPLFPANQPHVVLFYEPENDVSAPGGIKDINDTDYPAEHCLHILYLATATTTPTPTPTPGGSPGPTVTAFDASLKCCYDPW